MPTLSFHAPLSASRKIRAAAKQRRIPVSRFLRDAAEAAATGAPVTGLGRELERMAIDALAEVSLARVRARAKTANLDKLEAADITAIVKTTRRDRQTRP